MDNTTLGQDHWDLDLRIEPARAGSTGVAMTGTYTMTYPTTLSRAITACCNSDACPEMPLRAFAR